MPDASPTEFYFIGAMMVLIVILCVVSVFIFIKTYKKEMREKREREAQKNAGYAPKDTRQE